MASSTKFPTASAVFAAGDVDWTGLGNLYADDTSYAEAVSFPDSGVLITDTIDVTGFGFAIPSTATINGITVTINRRATMTTPASVTDYQVQLRKSSGAVGNDKASASIWTATLSNAVYGSASDLWGTTWTATEINDASFGVRFSALEYTDPDFSVNPIIDYFTIEVTYTEAASSSIGNMFMMFE